MGPGEGRGGGPPTPTSQDAGIPASWQKNIKSITSRATVCKESETTTTSSHHCPFHTPRAQYLPPLLLHGCWGAQGLRPLPGPSPAAQPPLPWSLPAWTSGRSRTHPVLQTKGISKQLRSWTHFPKNQRGPVASRGVL